MNVPVENFPADHFWQPWSCHLHGWISDIDKCCPDCTLEFYEMGTRLGDLMLWEEEVSGDHQV